MPQNLQQKIMLMLNDTESMSRSELCKRIEKLIEQEIDYLKHEHELSVFDVETIKSNAVGNFINTSMGVGSTHAGEVDRLRAYCYIQATLGYLRSKGLYSGQLTYNGKRK